MTASLLIGHHDQLFLSLIDAASLELQSQIPVPGRVAVLGSSGHHRYGFAVHRDDHCVSIVTAAGTLQTVMTDQQPTHFHTHDSQIVIFNDGSGSVSLFNEEAIDQPPATFKATQPDHGSAVILGEYLLAGHLRLGRVDIYHLGETEPVSSFDKCPALHGVAQIGDVALFGASDGVLLIKKQGHSFRSVKLDNPKTSRARVGLFATHPRNPLAIGNYGEGLAVIDPEQNTMVIHPLPSHPLKFRFDDQGEYVLVLAVDGRLYRLNPQTGECLSLLAVTSPVEPPRGPDGKPRPTFALYGDDLYVISPQDEMLSVVDMKTLTIKQQVACAPNPSMITVLQTK